MAYAGFSSPVGSDAERATGHIYPGDWVIVTGYATYYTPHMSTPAYHTGSDIIAQAGETPHSGVHAAADGMVICSRRFFGTTWGNVIVIRHQLATSQKIYSRYGHVENVLVKRGDTVQQGQHICDVGNAFGIFAYHLHFDISPSVILETKPFHWPGINLQDVYNNYVNPDQFLTDGSLSTLEMSVGVNVDTLNVRSNHTVNSAVVTQLHRDDRVIIDAAEVAQDGHQWSKIIAGPLIGNWIARELVQS